jgi:hypothetical protein
MKSVRGIAGTDRQLRWVILLLVIAVILPTVCLLWFMTQAVRNERLAVRQKLMDVCNDRVADARNSLNTIISADMEKKLSAIRAVGKLIGDPLWIDAVMGDANGLVIYDANDYLIYPVLDSDIETDFSDDTKYAFGLEQRGDYSKALKEYQRISKISESSSTVFAASMGMIRCLDKLGRYSEILDLFHELL